MTVADPIRIANCSGYYGDRPSGAIEMVNGGPIDVLTGDWLAELTMLILARKRASRPGGGFAGTFVDQMEEVMAACLNNDIKVVSNAGGLDPAGCADAVAEVAGRLGLSPSIAFVDGDDLMARLSEIELLPFAAGQIPGDPASYLTANAYLGCWGIVDALDRGADIVITGRVTDAALACGPAAWHHRWEHDDWDALAGGVVAGHVIECSAQATGGNYSFFDEIDDHVSDARFGFPWADVAEDGSSVIGKHDGTGGAVTIGTVTSQLLYEIGGPRYLGPDVTVRFDTIALEQAESDRVHISGVKGEPPPTTLKVGVNELGGYRNSFEVALTGLDIEEKARFAEAAFWDACPLQSSDFDSVRSVVVRTDKVDPHSNEEATALWRVTVKDRDEQKVGRAFSDAIIQTALSSIPGMYALGGAPRRAEPFGVFRPALLAADSVATTVHIDGQSFELEGVSVAEPFEDSQLSEAGPTTGDKPADEPRPSSDTERVPLGRLAGTRSGDKGGDANLGVFVRSAEAFVWLDNYLTTERLRSLLPEATSLNITRHRFANLLSLNFVIHGLLEEGVAASSRQDRQAKSLGEWLRARHVDIPRSLLE